MKINWSDILKKTSLGPFAYLWKTVHEIRRTAYRYKALPQEEFKVPIISIGNLAFGGTGKTPFTLWLSNYFNEIDFCTMILTRGYKGKLEKSHGIIMGGQTFRLDPETYGDEPLLLAQGPKRGAVVVGKNRSANLKYYFPQVLPDVILLDDGFQHLKLHRNLDIVLIDSTTPIRDYSVAPLGYFREAPTALQDADAVVLGRSDLVSIDKLARLKEFLQRHTHPGTPFVHMEYSPKGLYDCFHNVVYGANQLENKRFLVVLGLASEASFLHLCSELKLDVVDKIIFGDHHKYTPEEIASIIKKADELGVEILTSEKDIVKIRKVLITEKILYLGIQVKITQGEKELVSLIREKTGMVNHAV